MVSHCANPACGVPLRYLRDGRLYQFEVRCKGADTLKCADLDLRKNSRYVSHYWLCGLCSTLLTLQFDSGTGVVTITIEQEAARAASAA